MSLASLSKEDIVKELLRCGKSPAYFIDNYCKIYTIKHGMVPFKTWEYQKDVLQDFLNYPHNIILKPRQMGISTLTAAYCAWLMLFNKGRTIMVLGIKQSVSKNLVKKVKQIIKALPEWFQKLATITIDNRISFCLSNGSQIEAASKASDVGRSDTLSLLVIDEAAHIANMDEVWTAVGPAMSTGGRSIAISTPNGQGNWFFNKYMGAEKGENEFHAIRLKWQMRPDYDDEWEASERKKYSKKQWEQEYEANFLSSGNTVIDSEILEKIFKGLRPPLYKGGPEANLWIWEAYNPAYNYLITADVARGDGTDYSAFHIINIEKNEQAAEYRGKIEYDVFATFLNQIGLDYGGAMVVIENNMLGHAVATKMIELKYPNMFYSQKGSHEYVAPYEVSGRSDIVPGFTTNVKTRPWIISRFEESVRNGLLVINSERTYSELTTFIWVEGNKGGTGRSEAARGYNDDLIISLALSTWVRETALKESTRGVNYKKASLKAMFFKKTVLDTKIKGQMGYNSNMSSFKPVNENSTQGPQTNQQKKVFLKFFKR